MSEKSVIFIASHIVIAASCLLVLATIAWSSRFRTHSLMLPVAVWLLSKIAAHASYVLMIYGVIGHDTVIVCVALNAAASAVSGLCISLLLLEWMRQPTIREMRVATDAMAKTISDLTEGSE